MNHTINNPESPMEQRLYFTLRDLDLSPILQYPVGRYFVDVAFPEQKIAIEYDSVEFHKDLQYDQTKTKVLTHHGWTVYRISCIAKKGLKWKITKNDEWIGSSAKFYDLIEMVFSGISNAPIRPNSQFQKLSEIIKF